MLDENTMRVHVILNTGAGLYRHHPALLERIERACRGRALLHATRSLSDLTAACGQIAQAGTDLVVLCGGDGTHMAGVTRLVRAFGESALPPVSLVRGGRAGTVARSWNGRSTRNPVDHVTRVLLRAGQSASLPIAVRPSLWVDEPGGERRVGFIFGTGMIASFFREFYARGGGGYREAGRMIATIFVGSFFRGALARNVLSPMSCNLTVDGVRHPADGFSLIACSVLRNLGMHLMVTHRGGEDPNRPHLVASTLDVRGCGMQFWRILTGQPLKGSGQVDTLVDCFRVDFRTGDGAYVLDGELFSADSVQVAAGPLLKVVLG